jgi:Fe-S-cluster containining protein
LWDGKATNAEEKCMSCGLCCHNSEKSLFPGEYEYLKLKTGQSNSAWVSPGCMCSQFPAKPVICKIYPLRILLNWKEWIIADDNYSYYSDRCVELDFPKNDQMMAYFDFLFSDPDNRLHFLINHCLEDEIIPHEKAELKKRGVVLTAVELYKHSLKKALGFESDYGYI